MKRIIFGLIVILILIFIVLWFLLPQDRKNQEIVFEGRGEQAVSVLPNASENRGEYILYDKNLDLNSISGKRILFFYADWYPESKKIDEAIKTRIDELPVGVKIIKVDFDNSFGLREKYEIKNQQTFVLLDDKGASKSVWIENNFDLLLEDLR
jgi:hypothetical protein